MGSSSNAAASEAAHAAVRAPDVDALFAAAMTPDAAEAEESREAREYMDEFGVAAITEACGWRKTEMDDACGNSRSPLSRCHI